MYWARAARLAVEIDSSRRLRPICQLHMAECKVSMTPERNWRGKPEAPIPIAWSSPCRSTSSWPGA